MMLGGSVAFLVGLYFVWIRARLCIPHGGCFPSNAPGVAGDGWGGFGQTAALLGIALAAGAIAGTVNQGLANRLPLGRVTIALGIFALLSVSETWASSVASTTGLRFTIGLGPGAYIGLAGAGVAGAGAVVARWDEIMRPPRATTAVGQLITLALISSFVLPVLNASAAPAATELVAQFEGRLATFICVFACLGLLAWQRPRPGPRLATAAAIGTLVAAHLLPLRHASAGWPYELWLLVASAAGLLVLSLITTPGLWMRRLDARELAVVAGSVLVLASMFLPWQSFCDSERCSSSSGWSSAELAGVFALGLLVTLVLAGRVAQEFAIGAAIFVLSAGLAVAIPHDFGLLPQHAPPPPTLNLDYGAFLGFAGAALLVVSALGPIRPVPDKRFFVRLVPVLGALTLVAFGVTPSLATIGDVLDNHNLFLVQSPFLTVGLLGATTVLLTLRLLFRWFDGPGTHAELVRLPLVLLALTALTVIHDAIVTTNFANIGISAGKGVSWEGWAAICLCVVLAACGWLARSGDAFERRNATPTPGPAGEAG